MNRWRVGSKVPLNVYDGEGRPVCQCHNASDALRIVEAVNQTLAREPFTAWSEIALRYLMKGGWHPLHEFKPGPHGCRVCQKQKNHAMHGEAAVPIAGTLPTDQKEEKRED